MVFCHARWADVQVADGAREDTGTPIATRTAPTAGLPASSPTNATGVQGAVQSPGAYSTENDPDGDATAQFTPTSGGGQADQMPSEFGARGTGASGSRPEEGRI